MSATTPTEIQFNNQGLIPAICQDASSGQILMVANMNPESLGLTMTTGDVHFYSRSRQEIWHKGETSGNFLKVRSIQLDCDGDALLFQVDPAGPACHTGAASCFFTNLEKEFAPNSHISTGPEILSELFHLVEDRKINRPAGSYTTALFDSGTSRIAQKVAEEGSEVAIAAATKDSESVAKEVADLMYHTLVLLADAGVSPGTVWAELKARQQR
jgi:phosphoribosyl-ATP pyrophosphohydrolase/phosphoribosyl-AMP cyclohydrolase